MKTDLGVSLGGRKLIAEELKKLGPGGGGGANDPKNAAGQVAQESSPVVPEWSSPPATGAVGAFAELQQNKGPPLMSRVVTLGGRQVPLVAVTGGAVAVILLLLLVVAIVPSSGDCVNCGKLFFFFKPPPPPLLLLLLLSLLRLCRRRPKLMR